MEGEIHPSAAHAADGFAKVVSVIVGMLGVVLAIVSIASHRAHTAAVIYRGEANDKWSYFEAKKIREHVADGIGRLAAIVATKDDKQAQNLAQQLVADSARYAKDSAKIEQDATEREAASHREEIRALRLDVAEGFLELGLVLSSLYFLSRRRLFPALGGVAALAGVAIGISNFWV